MKRKFCALVVVVLLSTTARSGAPDGERALARAAKSYPEILMEFFGLKPRVAATPNLPAKIPNMRCMNCENPVWEPSPSDCGKANLPAGCGSITYCKSIPSDPRCSAVPPS